MADTITVTFGGREVVLKPRGDHIWHTDNHRLIEYGSGTYKALLEPLPGDGWGESPQAAFTALESKLRSLRDELDRVLGGG